MHGDWKNEWWDGANASSWGKPPNHHQYTLSIATCWLTKENMQTSYTNYAKVKSYTRCKNIKMSKKTYADVDDKKTLNWALNEKPCPWETLESSGRCLLSRYK